MKVKIRNTYFNSNDTPIMIILNEKEKLLIRDMPDYCDRFCAAPDHMEKHYIEGFMGISAGVGVRAD